MNRHRAQLIDRLESCGQDYLWFLDHLAQEEPYTVPGAGEWSVHQVAAHMRDTEVHVFLLRTQLLLASEHPAVENFDQEAWNRDHYVPSEPLKQIKAEFRTARRKLTRLLRGANKSAWDNWAQHPEFGRISLDWLLEHNYVHTLDHLAQIGRLREAATLRALNSLP